MNTDRWVGDDMGRPPNQQTERQTQPEEGHCEYQNQHKLHTDNHDRGVLQSFGIGINRPIPPCSQRAVASQENGSRNRARGRHYGMGVTTAGDAAVTTPLDRPARTEIYRAAIGRIPQVLLVIDAQAGILDISNEVRFQLGYEPDDLVGRQVFDFIHPSDHQHVALQMMREVSEPTSQAESIRCRLRHADGMWREFEVQGTNQFDKPEINGVVVALRDISERRLGDRVMAAGDYLYSSLATIASDATTIFDAAGNRVYSSPSLAVMLGYSPEELAAIPPSGLVHPDDLDLWRASTKLALASDNGTSRTEVRLLRSDGNSMWIEATVVNLLKDSGVGGVVVHARDIDQRRQAERALRRQATHDALTGLANRFALMEQLVAADTADGPTASGHALLFCDLDGFKEINDTHGHGVGDETLIAVARAIERAVRPTDFVARIGGDEFCILGRGLTSRADAISLAERVRDHISATGSNDRHVGVSIGAAWVPAGGVRADHLLTRADRAMYTAKRRGSNLIETVEIAEAEIS
jgi:diguanylate cyclase (GGDEF)-like protein/PAS domain S-box-containing protein